MASRKIGAGVQIHSGKLRIWFNYKGQRCFESLNLSPSDANQRAAAKLRAEICEKIRHGVFDYATYFPESVKATTLRQESLTFETMSNLWLTGQTHLAKSTVDGYRSTLNFHWLPKLANRSINTITYTELMAILGAMKFKSGKTRNNTIIPLRRIFEAAYADELIPSNPAARIIYVKHQKKKPDPLSLEELEMVLSYIGEHYPMPVINYFEFAFFTGLRTSEQIELRWEDIDFRRRVAHVHRAKVRQEINEHTKTYVGREVELNSRAFAALERQRSQTTTSLIFFNPNTNEQYIDDRPLRRVWTPVLKALGMRHRACYQTRHTFATLMLMSGVNPAWAANQLGHSVQMFLNTYARWIREADNGRELSKLENVLNQKAAEPIEESQLKQRSNSKKCAKSVPKKKQPPASGCFSSTFLVVESGTEPKSVFCPQEQCLPQKGNVSGFCPFCALERLTLADTEFHKFNWSSRLSLELQFNSRFLN